MIPVTCRPGCGATTAVPLSAPPCFTCPAAP